MKAKFLVCRHCGNLVGVLHDSKVPMICCGQKIEQLVPNTVETAQEKHVPVVNVEDGAVFVNIGEINHPMIDVHYIEWVYVETQNGGQRHSFKPGDEPCWTFHVGDDKPVAVYAYCNLHGLWAVEI